MLGYGSRAGAYSTAMLASFAALGISVMAVRSPWSPYLISRLAALGRPQLVTHFDAPVIRPSDEALATAAAQPDLDKTSVARQSFRPLTANAAEWANVMIPFARGGLYAAPPFQLAGTSTADMRQARECLAAAVHYEAASESLDGQRAVAQVVLNRVRNPVYPKTVCGVVYQGWERPTGCQFTFTCDGSLARKPSPIAWSRALTVADEALHGRVFTPVGLATHYHTRWVVPYWATSLAKLNQIGAHIFYRWNGALGAPGGFTARYAGGEALPVRLATLRPDIAPPDLSTATAAPVALAAAPSQVSIALAAPTVVEAHMDAAPVAPLPDLGKLETVTAPVIAPDPVRPHSTERHVSRLAVPSGW